MDALPEGHEVRDDLVRASELATSNPLLNQIYEAVLWGAKDNYRSIPTDCPQRDERQGWLGDRSRENPGETYLFDVATFYAKWVADMGHAQDAGGRISDDSPAYWPFYSDNVTCPASFIMVTNHLYEQYGEVRVIEQSFPGMRKWITHMETYLQNGLMPRDAYGNRGVPPESPELIHSYDPNRKTDATVIGIAYFCRLLRLMEHFAAFLGTQEGAKEYSQLAGKLLVACNKTYFHDAASQYSNESDTSSLLPLAFRTVPEEDRGALRIPRDAESKIRRKTILRPCSSADNG
jgi:alpha-L-rhamnosidase